MNPSQDQIKSALRTLIAAVGGAVAGWAIAKGWITQDQATAILSNQQVLDAVSVLLLTGVGSLAAFGSGVWGLITHKQANMVATVAAMPDVAEVKVMPTQAGVDLANAARATTTPIPGAVVTVAASGTR